MREYVEAAREARQQGRASFWCGERHYVVASDGKRFIRDKAAEREKEGNSPDYSMGAGFTLASGKPLADAAPDEFVLKNGSPVWGRVTEELALGRSSPGELRVQVGNAETGLIHAKKHEREIQGSDVQMGERPSVENFIDYIFQNATSFLPISGGKHFMVVERDGDRASPCAVVAWKDRPTVGGHYTLISVYAANKRTVRKQKSLSSGGTVSQSPAPARVPLASGTSARPEGGVSVRYGESDSVGQNIP
ncbi:MAG: hypothetical protein LBR38_05580 [Synergistaceae bacterium]|jgi:hypothetical protein|nr:hypothetical protein [Synergistaceae bacterium]